MTSRAAATDPRPALRLRLIAAREALAGELRARHSARIDAALEALLQRLAPAVIGFCWPIRGEFDVRPLAERAVGAGRRMALPVIDGDTLFFREWTPASPLAADRLGIRFPLAGETLMPALILMPLVGFDDAGYRLGYGGGYFDRSLAGLAPQPVAVGVGFELSRLESITPQRWDIPCDYVVTEAGAFGRRDGRLQPLV